MSKRSNFKGLHRVARAALPLVALMAAGALAADHRPFPTSDPAQTRVRGQGQQTQSRAINSFPINCPSEKYKKVNLPLDQEKVVFKISNDCFCNPFSEDGAHRASDAAGSLRTGLIHLANSIGNPKHYLYERTNKMASDFRNGDFRSLTKWLNSYGFRLGHELKVTVPPGSSKKESAFCYERGYVEGLFKQLVTEKP